MTKAQIFNKVKHINQQLFDLGFTPEQVIEFWNECKNEAKQK